jgi:hypothetical protein
VAFAAALSVGLALFGLSLTPDRFLLILLVPAIVLGRPAGDGLEAVRGEAAALRVPRRTALAFVAAIRIAWKDGFYTLCTPACRFDRTLGGWISVPFKTRRGVIRHRTYVFGMFAEDVPSGADAALAWDRGPEVLRQVIRPALRSWKRAR